MTNTGYRQYLRRWRVIVYHNKSGDGIDVTNLRTVFAVSKALKGEPDTSSVAICNVSSETANAIVKGDKVILEAGYENGNYGLIFTGDVTQVIIKRDGETENAVTMTVTDGDKYYRKSFVCTTVGAGASQSDIVDECLSGAEGVTKGNITDKLNDALLPRGKVLFGKSSTYLSQIAAGNTCEFYITDGSVNIVSADDYDSDTAVELTPSTGLIGTPTQIDDGIKAKCLINPSIKINTRVHVDSSYVQAKQADKGKEGKPLSVNGVYKVTKLKFSGDTHGDDWYCEFEGVEVAGKQVSGNVNAQTNVWR